MAKKKLYVFLLLACFIGFIYLFYSIQFSKSSALSVCMIKNVTGYSCPSCGTTRAVQLLLKGDFLGSLQMNPFGILVAMIMVLLPFWILFDWITRRETFYSSYKKTETIIGKKWVAVFLLILVVLNWIWNLYKQL